MGNAGTTELRSLRIGTYYRKYINSEDKNLSTINTDNLNLEYNKILKNPLLLLSVSK